MAPMAGVRGVAILALAVMVWIAEGPGMAVAQSQNGLPRPDGYALNATYGPTPPCLLNNVAVTCDWYGFVYTLYPAEAEVCLITTRTFLANTTLVPPGELLPYEYYFLNEFVFNHVNNASYCLYGCFDMSATGPVASPPSAGSAPPPALHSPPALAPSPVAKAPPPPPALLSPPAVAPAPVAITPPPPSVLVSPPPPVLVSPPPPSLLASPPPPSVLVSPPPPALLTSPPPPSTSKSPPPPPKTVSAPPPPQLFNLGDVGILRVPTGLVWFVISGALLILSGLVAF